jgi:hypothetical protein
VHDPALDGGIDILADDRLDGILRPRVQSRRARTCGLERTVGPFFEADDEVAATMVRECDDFLGNEGSMIIAGQAIP